MNENAPALIYERISNDPQGFEQMLETIGQMGETAPARSFAEATSARRFELIRAVFARDPELVRLSVTTTDEEQKRRLAFRLALYANATKASFSGRRCQHLRNHEPPRLPEFGTFVSLSHRAWVCARCPGAFGFANDDRCDLCDVTTTHFHELVDYMSPTTLVLANICPGCFAYTGVADDKEALAGS